MLTELVLDGLVAALLAVTVGYCFVLNRRLSALRNGQDGLLEVVRILNVATEQARAGVRELHQTGETVGGYLSDKVTEARAMTDELSLIVESGDNLADRLAAEVSDRRPPVDARNVGKDSANADAGFGVPHPGGSSAHGAGSKRDDPGGIMSELHQALRAVR